MENFKIRNSVRTKLVASFLAVAILALIVSGTMIFSMKRVDASYSRLLDVNVKVLDNAMQIQYDADHQTSLLREYFLLKAPDDKKGIEQDSRNLSALVQSSLNMEVSAQTKASFQKIDTMNRQFLQESDALLSGQNVNDALKKALNEQLFEFGVKIMNEAQSIVDEHQKSIDSLNAVNSKQANLSIVISIVLAVISFIAAVAIGLIMSLKITRPLSKVVDIFSKVAEGNLRETVSIKNKDEIGQLANAANAMVKSLRDVVSDVLTSVQSVAAASQQISASTEEIAGGSENQAQAAQTMNDMFRELSQAINSVAESAEIAAELSGQTVKVASEGGAVVQNSVTRMEEVNQQVARLEDDSNKIGDIIEVIDDIAEQTNLLALNAAIEAARAGEHGKGFAVVADEVRKLAERSIDATKQISAIIKGMQENTGTSVKAVHGAVELARETGESFRNIIKMINESSDKVSEIAAASEEQAAQTKEVSHSIDSIAGASQESSAACEETASSSQSLAKLAEDLNHAVSVFKL